MVLIGPKNPVILKITDIPNENEEFKYDGYSEIRITEPIAPKYISITDMPADIKPAMRRLCHNHIYVLSNLCETCARYYTQGVRTLWTKREINQYLNNAWNILQRLDFNSLSNDEKYDSLKDLGENGEYTMFDDYLKTDHKLYEISMYDDPVTQTVRNNIQKFIINNFSNCLDIDTGGWDNIF